MVGEKLRLCLGRLGPLLFQHMCDPRVQRLPLAPQQRAIGGVLDQRVLEEEGGLGRRSPTECEAGDDELIQRGLQLSRVPLRDGRQQPVGELPAEGGADLRNLLGGRGRGMKSPLPGKLAPSPRQSLSYRALAPFE